MINPAVTSVSIPDVTCLRKPENALPLSYLTQRNENAMITEIGAIQMQRVLAMATKSSSEENRLTIDLPEDVARRLKLAAITRRRTVSGLVVELLDKHLPHVDAGGKKKTNIPYS